MPLDFTPTIFKSFCIISVTDFIHFWRLLVFLQNKSFLPKAQQLGQAHGPVLPIKSCRDAVWPEVLELFHVLSLFSSESGIRNELSFYLITTHEVCFSPLCWLSSLEG